MSDPVNHPSHYIAHPSGVECIDIAEHYGFCIGNTIKYLWRAGLKGDVLVDLKKARWYLEREIQRRENVPSSSPALSIGPPPSPVVHFATRDTVQTHLQHAFSRTWGRVDIYDSAYNLARYTAIVLCDLQRTIEDFERPEA